MYRLVSVQNGSKQSKPVQLLYLAQKKRTPVKKYASVINSSIILYFDLNFIFDY